MVFYIATKLILCSIVLVQVLLGIPESWKEVSSAEVENIVKTGFIMGDLCVIELFLVSLETYFSLCFSAFTDAFARVPLPPLRSAPACSRSACRPCRS